MNLMPLVSIIIPVYNGEKYLRQAIDSALSQTYNNIEVLVINDGSTDETDNIALSYKNKISYYKKENGGVATALNLGIEKMRGDYFSWLSHDDIYLEDKIAQQVSLILKQREPQNTVVYSSYGVFFNRQQDFYSVNLPYIDPKNFRYWITVENRLHGCTLLIPKAAFDTHGMFNPSLRTTQDYDMWFRIAKTYRFVHIDDITVLARAHSEQGSLSFGDIVKSECDELIKSFIEQLQPEEVINGSKKDLKLGYLEIAESCLARNFMGAYHVANELNGVRSQSIICHIRRKISAILFTTKIKKIIKRFFIYANK